MLKKFNPLMSYRFRLSPIEKLEISQRTIGD